MRNTEGQPSERIRHKGGFRLLTLLAGILGIVALGSGQTVSKLSLSPASVAGGTGATGTVTISKKAPSSGFKVTLSSASTNASTASSVLVSSGATSATFAITTIAVAATTTAKIKASAGSSSATASLTIKAPTLSTLTLDPTTVTGGSSSTGTVYISSGAPTSGIVVKLSCVTSGVKVPPSVKIAGGSTHQAFTITTSAVSKTTSAKIVAALGSSSIADTLTLNPLGVSGLTLNPSTVGGGVSSTGTVTLGAVAPSGGVKVALASSSSMATVPSTVTVAGGSQSGTFAVSTKSVTSQTTVNITAKLGTSSQSATLTLTKGSTYAGNYKGSFYSTNGGGIGTVSMTISASGGISGTTTDYSTGTANQKTLTGTVGSDGSVTVSVSSSQGNGSASGRFYTNSLGALVGFLKSTNGQGGSNDVTVTVNAVGRSSQFAGVYAGTSFVPSTNALTTIGNLSITSSGAVSASDDSGSTLTGTIDAAGILKYTIQKSGGSSSSGTIYCAFDASGLLEGVTFDSQSVETDICFTKSFAGAYSLTIDSTKFDFLVNASGAVSGVAESATSPQFMSGTISSTGVVNISVTGTGGNATITGVFFPLEGAFQGTGNAQTSAGTVHWSGGGIPSQGLPYVGTYHLSLSNSTSFTATIDVNGIVTGSISGYTLVGCVVTDGSLVMAIEPTSILNASNAALLSGVFMASGTKWNGTGAFKQLSGASGTWTMAEN